MAAAGSGHVQRKFYFYFCRIGTTAVVPILPFHARGRKGQRQEQVLLPLPVWPLWWKCVWSGPRLCSNESPSGAFKRRAVCVSRWRGLAPTSSAGRDKREIKNLDSAEHSQSESGGYLKSKKGYSPNLKISIPRFLPVENSLRICYYKNQQCSCRNVEK